MLTRDPKAKAKRPKTSRKQQFLLLCTTTPTLVRKYDDTFCIIYRISLQCIYGIEFENAFAGCQLQNCENVSGQL